MNNTTKKPVLLICGCRKYEEYLHAALRRMDRPDFELIGILGDSVASFDPKTRILTLPVADTYEALPAKLHAAFEWIYRERPGIPGIFKTDDDMTFDMGIMVQAVKSNMHRPYWGMAVNLCKGGKIPPSRINNRFCDVTLRPSHQAAKYCFGAGYWISATSLPILVAAATEYQASALEDVCTGYVLNRAGIAPVCIQFPNREYPRIAELLAYK
jgi:hypothetical protein